MLNKQIGAALLLGALAACDGGGSGRGPADVPQAESAFDCSFVGGGDATLEHGCVSCGNNAVSSPNSAIDMDLTSAARVTTYNPVNDANAQVVIRITARAQDGIVFPSGTRPGVALRLPTGFATYTATVSTLLDGLPRESAQITPDPNTNGELAYFGFSSDATQTFDAVRLDITESQPNLEEHIYSLIEFCSDGTLR